MKNLMKTNGISLGPDRFNAVRNANLLSLLLDIHDIEAKKQRRVCARKIVLIKNPEVVYSLMYSMNSSTVLSFVKYIIRIWF